MAVVSVVNWQPKGELWLKPIGLVQSLGRQPPCAVLNSSHELGELW